MTGVLHTAGFWQSLLDQRFGRDPRALCGASLMCAGPEGDPGPDAPPCPDCAAWSAVSANRFWNAAVVAVGVCLAAFLASVIATTTGWHAVATGRAAGFSAIALVASGAWLNRAAVRCDALEPDDDMRPEDPYPCDHGDKEGTP